MKTKEEIIIEIKSIHSCKILNTSDICKYLGIHRHTLENYQKLGLPKLGRNKWELIEVIYWIKYILPYIK